MKKFLAILGMVIQIAFFTPTPITVHNAYAAAPTDYISCWDLEESAGATRVDEGSNSNSLSDNNTVGQTTGIDGNAADFENSSSEDQYLSITDASQTGLDISEDLSFSAWIRAETNTSAHPILGKSVGSNIRSYSFWVTAGILRLDVSDDGTVNAGHFLRWGTDSAVISTATTYHVVVTMDLSTETTIFYVNGSSVASGIDFGSSVGASLNNSGAAFMIGKGLASANDRFDGWIDIVEVYDRVLSSSEVTALYASGSGVGCTGRGGGGGAVAPVLDIISF